MAAGRSDWRGSMKRTISTKDGTLKWAAAREGDYLRLGESRFKIVEVSVVGTTELYVGIDNPYVILSQAAWSELGAHLERDVEEPQYDLLPTEEHAIVICGGDAYQRAFWGRWRLPGQEDTVTNEELQRFANARGFTRLVPESEVEAARKEGWKHGIRDAAADLEVTGFDDHARYIRSEYPTAFTQDGDGQDSSTVSVTFTKRSLCAFVECAEAAFNEAEMVDLGSGTSAWTTLLKARAKCEQDGGEQ